MIRPMRLRLALAAVVMLAGVGPGWAEVPRCMAMAHVRTVDRAGATTMQDSESVGPVLRVESDRKGLWLCSENHKCWLAADFDIVTPCTPEAMQSGTMTLR